MDPDQKSQPSSSGGQSSASSAAGASNVDSATKAVTQPVPTPPPSQADAAQPVAEVAQAEGRTGETANVDIHEYRDVAEGVKARVRTDEERAADAPSETSELDGVEVTTSRG